MTNFSHYTLQAAIYQLLDSDTTLLALVGGIYDRPPQGTAFPYITIGESSISDFSTKTTNGTEHVQAVHIWSRNGGRKEAALIMERVYTLLHQVSMSVTGQTLISIRFVTSEIMLENDGFTYQGIMRFRAVLEASA